jgi:small-conductance mechanosensitive channel
MEARLFLSRAFFMASFVNITLINKTKNMNFKAELMSTLQEYWQLLAQWTPRLAMGIIVLGISWFLAVKAKRMVGNRLRSRMDDPVLAKFLSTMVKWISVLIGIALSMKVMGLGDIAGGLVAGAGFSAIIVGFAFKDIGENFMSGILLAFRRPFRVGDTIEVENTIGNVVSLDIRITQVKTFDGKDVFIPNSTLIKNHLINYTIDGFLRQDFLISVDYETNLSKAITTILQTLENVSGILKGEKKPTVVVSRLDTSSIALQVFYWLDTFDKSVSGLKVKTEAIQGSLRALEAEDVYMPADILEVKTYRDQVLQLSTQQEHTG